MAYEALYHDLDQVLEVCLHQKILGLAKHATIEWGKKKSPRPMEEQCLGSLQLSYCDQTTGFITVSQALDQLWIPGYFVRSVVQHELLHLVVPCCKCSIHTDLFRYLERQLPGYSRAQKWYDKNVDHLLRGG
jgi:hypothetical protein